MKILEQSVPSKGNANAISPMAGTNLVYLKTNEEKPLWLKNNR